MTLGASQFFLWYPNSPSQLSVYKIVKGSVISNATWLCSGFYFIRSQFELASHSHSKVVTLQIKSKDMLQ